MKSQTDEAATAFESSELLHLEPGAWQERLVEVDKLPGSYKKAEALLHGEQRLTEQIARGNGRPPGS
jgi:hypothetical protein